MTTDIFPSSNAVATPALPYLISGYATSDGSAEPSRSATATAASLTLSAMASTAGLDSTDGVFISGATNKKFAILNVVTVNTSSTIYRPPPGTTESVTVQKCVRIPVEFECKAFRWGNLGTLEMWEWFSGMPLNSAIKTTAAGVRTYETEPGQGGSGSGVGVAVIGGSVYLMPALTPTSSSFIYQALG